MLTLNNQGNIIEFDNPFFLAPLAGITDAVMRSLSFSMGAALTYTEMVSAKGIHYGDSKTERLLYIPEDGGPTAIQIFGSDPDIMGEAARKLNDRKNVILDINMGCPAPKIVKNGDGSALMKNPELVYKIVKSVVSNTDKPVTVKIRKGFDSNDVNAVTVAKAVEEGGASGIAVHGRTREQYYSGEADWNIIREVKRNVAIPVIGNGDVTGPKPARQMMCDTGCDFVMVGRAALGNPWIFKELSSVYKGGHFTPPTEEEKNAMMINHLDRLIELKGEYIAVREMRKYIAWYIKGKKNAARIRHEINKLENASEMRDVINAGVKMYETK